MNADDHIARRQERRKAEEQQRERREDFHRKYNESLNLFLEHSTDGNEALEKVQAVIDHADICSEAIPRDILIQRTEVLLEVLDRFLNVDLDSEHGVSSNLRNWALHTQISLFYAGLRESQEQILEAFAQIQKVNERLNNEPGTPWNFWNSGEGCNNRYRQIIDIEVENFPDHPDRVEVSLTTSKVTAVALLTDCKSKVSSDDLASIETVTAAVSRCKKWLKLPIDERDKYREPISGIIAADYNLFTQEFVRSGELFLYAVGAEDEYTELIPWGGFDWFFNHIAFTISHEENISHDLTLQKEVKKSEPAIQNNQVLEAEAKAEDERALERRTDDKKPQKTDVHSAMDNPDKLFEDDDREHEAKEQKKARYLEFYNRFQSSYTEFDCIVRNAEVSDERINQVFDHLEICKEAVPESIIRQNLETAIETLEMLCKQRLDKLDKFICIAIRTYLVLHLAGLNKNREKIESAILKIKLIKQRIEKIAERRIEKRIETSPEERWKELYWEDLKNTAYHCHQIKMESHKDREERIQPRLITPWEVIEFVFISPFGTLKLLMGKLEGGWNERLLLRFIVLLGIDGNSDVQDRIDVLVTRCEKWLAMDQEERVGYLSPIDIRPLPNGADDSEDQIERVSGILNVGKKFLMAFEQAVEFDVEDKRFWPDLAFLLRYGEAKNPELQKRPKSPEVKASEPVQSAASSELTIQNAPVLEVKTKPKQRQGAIGGKQELIQAFLVCHHKYEDGIYDMEVAPATNKQVSDGTNASKSTVSDFFRDQFGSHKKYKEESLARGLLNILRNYSGDSLAKIQKEYRAG